MLRRVLQLAWSALAAGLFLIAVVLTVARVWAPSLGAYRQDIETAASAALQRPVSIGHVEATWRGLQPVFRLRNVVIAGTQPVRSLGVSEIQVSIDVIQLLRARELRFSGIDIIGATLTLARDADGRVIVQEFAGRAGTDLQFGALAAMSRLSIHDTEVTVTDIPRGAGAQHFSAVNLTLTNDGNEHYMSGHAQLPGQLGDRIEIVARLRGDIARPSDWRGRAYFKGQGLTLSSLLAPTLEPSHRVQGTADLRLWAQLAASRITAVSGELQVDDLDMSYAAGGHQSAFAADKLQATFGWRQFDQGWRAVLQQLQVTRPGRQWNTGHLLVAATPQADGLQLQLATARLDLDEITGLVPLLPALDTRLRDLLVSVQPTGLIEDLRCTFTRTATGAVLDRIAARFTGLGMLQYGALPRLAGLDGSIDGVAQGGTVLLGSDRLVVEDGRLFRAPLQFDKAGGALSWQLRETTLALSSPALTLVNPQLALTANLQLEIPRAGGAATSDTRIQVHEFAVAHTGAYLPAQVMPATSVAWLDRALAGGMVHDGSVLIQGPLDRLPFDHGEGRLEVRLPVSDATLAFDEHWSPITQLDALVEFSGRQMDIRSSRGFIRTAALDQVHAQIRDLARPHLTIAGKVQGELPVMLAELGSSPLGSTYGGLVDHVTTTGHNDLALDIVIPLAHDGSEITVAGRIGLHDNTLQVAGTDIVLKRIRGRLAFDAAGIRSDGLQAELFGRQAAARVWTDTGKPVTHVTLDGKLALHEQVLAASAPLRNALHGDPDWHLELTVAGKPARDKSVEIGLGISSTLAGMAIDLPAPFGKPAAMARPLTIDIAALTRSERYLQARYGDALRAVLVLGGDGRGWALRRGNIVIGDAAPVAPQIPQLLLSGRLEHFRLADWQPHLAGAATGTAGPPLRISLQVAALDIYGYRLHDTGVELVESGTGWTLKAIGPSVAGEGQLVQRAGVIDEVSLDLQQLVLEPLAAETTAPAQPAQPDSFPLLQINAAKLRYQDIDFGRLQLQTSRPAGGGYRIERLSLASKLLSVQLSGDWRRQGVDQVSHADVEVTGGNIGALLDALGYQKLMKAGRPSGQLKASWRGAPWEARTEIIDGRFHALIKDGQLLDVEPGATGRALGLLSLTKLPKRLTLDFNDLFGAGFSFDRIEGDFVLDNGDAYTEKMVIDGPAAKIEISGRVGLVAQDYDELVTVTPYLSSSLPLAGAIAGGPAVGAAVIVAEKLLESKLRLNELARKQYEVTGPWSNPVVQPLNVPEPAPVRHDPALDADGFFR
ncbi:MAG: YhdP family protein [Pseudomonadota bacterium]